MSTEKDTLQQNNSIYLPSNNFKHIPSQDELTTYAVGCLSTMISIQSWIELPHNIRVKNLFNNHLWILNNCKVNNESIFNWVDYGIDTVSVANNSGQLGLISGSNEPLYGHIGINGSLTINGLSEQLDDLYSSVKQLNTLLTQTEHELQNKINQINIYNSCKQEM